MNDEQALAFIDDADAGLMPKVGMAPLRAYVEALQAERDRLRAAVAEYQRTYHALDHALDDHQTDDVEPQMREWQAARDALLDTPAGPARADSGVDISPTMGDPWVDAARAAVQEMADRGENVVVGRDGEVIEIPAAQLLAESSAGDDDLTVAVDPVESPGRRDATPGAPSDPPSLREPCPECEGRGWRINPTYFASDESSADGEGDAAGPVPSVDYREAVVTYDPHAGAAYVSVRPHQRVARTASVHPHDNVMLDYDDDGRLLGVEVVGIEREGDYEGG